MTIKGVAPPTPCTCEDGWVRRKSSDGNWIAIGPCTDCSCQICGKPAMLRGDVTTSVIDGICGDCYDEADRLAVRRADR